MNLDWDEMAARGLRCYVRLVAEAIGVSDEASLVQLDEPVCVYLALDRCPVCYPNSDLALVWDERHGWALALESVGCARLGWLDAGPLPAPRTVAAYVATACAGSGFGPAAPESGKLSRGLAARLALYAEPIPLAAVVNW